MFRINVLKILIRRVILVIMQLLQRKTILCLNVLISCNLLLIQWNKSSCGDEGLFQLADLEEPKSLNTFNRVHRNQEIMEMERLSNCTSLHSPSILSFLPHLLESSMSLQPAYNMTRGRSGVSLVLGIPTVRRSITDYLFTTLGNIISNMSPNELEDTLIVVFIGETDLEYVFKVSKRIEDLFSEHLKSGLIDIVSPHAAYYPNMESLRINLGDTPQRVRWRAKQNLDYAFLMMYSQPKGTFYVQLEDDIITRKHFISTMKNYAMRKIKQNIPWFAIEFSKLGFIGKMFKSLELSILIEFLIMFYNDKPADWLLSDLFFVKTCTPNKNEEYCKKEREKLWLTYKPSLFQHIGIYSSLNNKFQWKIDKTFHKKRLFYSKNQ